MKILVYSSDTCPHCVALKEFLNQKKVKYTVKDVHSDRKAAMDMIKKSGQNGIPVMDIDGKIIVGFDMPAIKKLLKLK